MRKVVKLFLWGILGLIAIIAVPVSLLIWQGYQLCYPEAINMGEMSARHGQHQSAAPNGKTISVTQLKDPPPSGGTICTRR